MLGKPRWEQDHAVFARCCASHSDRVRMEAAEIESRRGELKNASCATAHEVFEQSYWSKSRRRRMEDAESAVRRGRCANPREDIDHARTEMLCEPNYPGCHREDCIRRRACAAIESKRGTSKYCKDAIAHAVIARHWSSKRATARRFLMAADAIASRRGPW